MLLTETSRVKVGEEAQLQIQQTDSVFGSRKTIRSVSLPRADGPQDPQKQVLE